LETEPLDTGQVIHDLYYQSSYLTVNITVTLKCRLEVTQDHRKWYHSKAWIRFFYRAMHMHKRGL